MTRESYLVEAPSVLFTSDSLKDNSKTVAVKRIQNSESETHSIQWEVELMQRADGHLNILRYICTEKDDYFR